jgi:glyoxylase-like metal-dependent hydrolase (beta-lactamase superfamily II)
MRATRVMILVLAASLAACGDEPARTAAAPPAESGSPGLKTRDLDTYGEDLSEAVRIHDIVYQARGTANAQMVVTPDGNVVIDTGLPNQPRVQKQLRAADDGPISHVIVSHAHADHYGAADAFLEEGTELIAHREFVHNQRYLKALAPTFLKRNAIFFPNNVPQVPDFAYGALARIYPTIEPTLLVDREYAFERGGVRFEVLAMPGAEGSDGLCVWLPEQKILFTGDLFGHIFPMWPNLTTIRGERARFPWPYVQSLDRVLELDPVMLVPSHFDPITDREAIRAGVKRTRDAVAFVEEAVIDGINDGKDVFTLMREIRLPEELAIPEVHGKVSWGVRSIFEAYTGWFHLRSSTELYDVPRQSVDPEIVEMAGGPDAVAARGAARLQKGEPEAALHLADMALAAEPGNQAALRVRLDALGALIQRGGDQNHYEFYWLRRRIDETLEELDDGPPSDG